MEDSSFLASCARLERGAVHVALVDGAAPWDLLDEFDAAIAVFDHAIDYDVDELIQVDVRQGPQSVALRTTDQHDAGAVLHVPVHEEFRD